jgi:hypothetical protein
MVADPKSSGRIMISILAAVISAASAIAAIVWLGLRYRKKHVVETPPSLEHIRAARRLHARREVYRRDQQVRVDAMLKALEDKDRQSE